MNNLSDIRQYLITKRRLDTNSVRTYMVRIQIILEKNTLPLTKEQVEHFIYSLTKNNLKPNSINAYINALKHYESYCMDRGYPHGFSDGLQCFKRQTTHIEVLTDDEIDRILHCYITYGKFRRFTSDQISRYCNDLYHDFTVFLARTGARFEEAASITCEHIRILEGKVTFVDTKNKLTRSVWITEPLVGILQKRMAGKKPTDRIFQNIVSGKIIPTNYGLYLRRVAKQIGINKKLHPHIFRHSFATSLYSATKDIGLVQIVLGHKDISSTMIYIHLADDTVKNGLYRHPYNIMYVDPKDYLKYYTTAMQLFRLDNHPRFDANKVRLIQAKYINELYGAIC